MRADNKAGLLIIVLVVAIIAIAAYMIIYSLPNDSGTDQCIYTIPGKNYIGKSADECSRIRFACAEGTTYFADACGCGCAGTSGENGTEGRPTYCTEESRKVDACTKEYRPVCGWFNESVQCFAYPCASTYGNSCEACTNDMVAFFTEGECPGVS